MEERIDEKTEIRDEELDTQETATQAAEAEAEVEEATTEEASAEEAPKETATEEKDDFLYEGESNEKKTDTYDVAVRALVFGCLSVIFPMFALILYVLGSYLLAIAVGAAALGFAIAGFTAAKKNTALGGSLTAALAKTGRLVSLIGIAISALILAYVLIGLILAILAIIGIIIFYVFYFIIAIIISASTSGAA